MEDLTMTLARLSDNLFPSVPSLFSNFLGRDLMDWNNWNFADDNSTLPAVNIRENDNEFGIEVAAPGLKKDDFKVNYENGRLTISSEKKEEKKEKDKGKVTRREFSYQAFLRSFSMPENLVNTDQISAKYHDGILHVVVPKREEAKPKPAKEIKIS